MNGYTAGGTRCGEEPEDENARLQVPLSFMTVPTFTHTRKDLAEVPTDREDNPNGLGTNNNTMVQDTSVFLAGQLYCRLGAFLQATYDRVDDAFFLDNTDIRYSNLTRVAGIDVLYGVSLNNNPGVEDPWNTTPAWRIPGGGWVASAFLPGPPTPFLEDLGGIVAGGSGYLLVDNTFYVAAGAYTTLDKAALQALGEGQPGPDFDGAAPYWRAAIEKNWSDYSFMVGTYGMYANAMPDATVQSPNDKHLDIGFDSQLQYLHDEHFLTLRLSYSYEWDKLAGSYFIGDADNTKNHLEAFNVSGTYSYDSTYTLTLAYFNTRGSNDVTYFESNSGSPNTSGVVVDLGYSPWSHGGPSFWPWLNTRFGINYTHFNEINGATSNYDGSGRNAGDDDTLFLYAWTAF